MSYSLAGNGIRCLQISLYHKKIKINSCYRIIGVRGLLFAYIIDIAIYIALCLVQKAKTKSANII